MILKDRRFVGACSDESTIQIDEVEIKERAMTLKQRFLFNLIIWSAAMVYAETICAQTFIYKINSGEKEYFRKVVISKSESNYLLKISNTFNRDERIYNTDSSFAVLNWNFRNSETGTDLTAKRIENTIVVTGQFGNKKIDEKFEIDGSPWCQEWSLMLRGFALSDKNAIRVWTIDSSKFHDVHAFHANKEKMETIEVAGRKIEALHVKVRLKGMMKYLWSGNIWFRKSDGAFLFSRMTSNGPTGPLTVVQLISEK
jgi:hypothetical protein